MSGRNLEGGWLAIVAKRGMGTLLVTHIFSRVFTGAGQAEQDQGPEVYDAPARVIAIEPKEVDVGLSPPHAML